MFTRVKNPIFGEENLLSSRKHGVLHQENHSTNFNFFQMLKKMERRHDEEGHIIISLAPFFLYFFWTPVKHSWESMEQEKLFPRIEFGLISVFHGRCILRYWTKLLHIYLGGNYFFFIFRINSFLAQSNRNLVVGIAKCFYFFHSFDPSLMHMNLLWVLSILFLPMFHDKVLLRGDETMANYVYHPNYLQEMINYHFFVAQMSKFCN